MENWENRVLTSTDILKGIAIVFIVLNHIAWKENTLYSMRSVYWIYQAVPIFLVIMGIHNSISFKKKAYNLYDWYSWSEFGKRIKRLLVPYVVTYIIYLGYFKYRGGVFHRKIFLDFLFWEE